jgi:signal transduction histidine kinase
LTDAVPVSASHASEPLPVADEEERLVLLAEASRALMGSLGVSDPLPAILDLSRRLFAADAYAVWRRDALSGDWRTVADVALSDAFPRHISRETARSTSPGRPTMPDGPLAIEDVRQHPLLSDRQNAYQDEGIRSLLAIPLGAEGDLWGTVTFYYQEPRPFSSTEVRLATALANLAAAAIRTSEIYQEQSRMREAAERGRQRLAFLAEASTVLASSLDYETTLRHVARLVVPHLADWCTVHVKGDQGSVRQVAVAHLDEERVRWAWEVHERYPYDPNGPRGVPNVIRTGRSELYPEVSDEMLVGAARDPEQLAILRQLGIRSCMVVPMAIRDRVLGAISFYAAESGVRYGPEDVLLAESLAQRSAAAIENARLYRETETALTALREVDRRKDEFLSMLGHELRNPLGAIRNAVQVITRSEAIEERRMRAGGILQRQCAQLARLVEDLLDISRLRRGKLTLQPVRLDLAALVRATIEVHAPGPEGPRLTVKPLAEPVWVHVDPVRLTQVLANLLENAFRFTSADGEVSIALAIDGEWAQITVRDTGIGIPPELLPQLFETFARVEEVRSRSLGGLGLGLPLVKGLVELHGGEVRAESDGRDQGATFRVRLPLAQ